MATYLEFFELKQAPFDTQIKGRLVLGTPALRDALDAIKKGLKAGSPRICVNGGPGVGKTTLRRALPKLLGNSVRVVTLDDPQLAWSELALSIATQLQLPDCDLTPEALTQGRGNAQLLVLAIDSAERLSSESLEELDTLLLHLDSDGRQLLHLVLLADLHVASEGADVPLLWWLDQLATLQLEFAPIPERGVLTYIDRHLSRAGWTGGSLFTAEAASAIHQYSGGIPLAISQLCDRVLTEASRRGVSTIEAELVEEVCVEAPGASSDSGDEANLFADNFDASSPNSKYAGLPPELQANAPSADLVFDQPTSEMFESPAPERADAVSSGFSEDDGSEPLLLDSESIVSHESASDAPDATAQQDVPAPSPEQALPIATQEEIDSPDAEPIPIETLVVEPSPTESECPQAPELPRSAGEPIPERHDFNRLAAGVLLALALAGSAYYWGSRNAGAASDEAPQTALNRAPRPTLSPPSTLSPDEQQPVGVPAAAGTQPIEAADLTITTPSKSEPIAVPPAPKSIETAKSARPTPAAATGATHTIQDQLEHALSGDLQKAAAGIGGESVPAAPNLSAESGPRAAQNR